MNCTNPNVIMLTRDPTNYDKTKVIFYGPRKKLGDLRPEEYREISKGSIEVPCGNCLSCRLDYSRVWANRCYLESLTHKFNWFITLTYDDANLVYGDKGFPTVEKDALSSFMRKLRDKLGHDVKCRYFGCAEYGGITMRPHYHLILFGPALQDLTIDIPDFSKPMLKNGKYPIYHKMNSLKRNLMFSQTIYDCWQKGSVFIDECTWNTSAYVSRYIVKKQKGVEKVIYDRLGIEPEYLRMSNRPGIGADWLIYNKDKLLRFDYLSVKNNKGVQTSHPPRYFEKLMLKNEDSLDHDLMEANKINRIVNARKKSLESLSTKSVNQNARTFNDNLVKKSKVLKRDLT